MKCYNYAESTYLCDELISILNEIRKDFNFIPHKYIQKKSELLNDYMRKCALDSVVVAVSGGIDSAVVLALATVASHQPCSPIKKIVAVTLPCMDSTGVTNQKQASERARDLCKSLNIDCVDINIKDINNAIRDKVESALPDLTTDNWAIGQLVPYSRTPVLYYITSMLSASGYKGILLGTTNLSEGGYLGYVGKASDAMVDVQIIADIFKSEVYSIARELKIPSSIINVIPSGDMYDGRNDEMVFGASYDFVELYSYCLGARKNRLKHFSELSLNNLSTVAKSQMDKFRGNVEHLHSYNRHKYLSGFPSVFLNLWDIEISDGWHIPAWNSNNFS